MTENCREMQRFIAGFNAAIADLEKETREAETGSKKGESEIETLRSSIVKTKSDIEKLKQQRGDIEGEQKVVDCLLREHKAMEQKYDEIVTKETTKLDGLKKIQGRLTNEKTNDGFYSFMKHQDSLNKRMEEIMSQTKINQDTRDLQDRKHLEDKVHGLEIDLREETKRADQLKKVLVDAAKASYTTTAEERDAAAKYVKDTSIAVQKKYVTARLELYNIKHKHNK